MKCGLAVRCGKCGVYACHTGELEKKPSFCPMESEEAKEIFELAKKLYVEDEEVRRLALNAARVEAVGYNKWTRIEETIEFAKRCGFKKIGVAFCIGLRREAKVLIEVLERHGFEVFSVACKAGSIPKESIGLDSKEKVEPERYEVLCNPIAQAMLLNEVGTELNIIFGLCVGHDSLFIRFSKALVTCLVVKDRVLAHNPIGAIYTAYSYYSQKLSPSADKKGS